MRTIAAIALAAAATSCAGSSAPTGTADTGVPKALAEQERFSTLVELLRTSGVDLELAAGGPYTVFAPTNSAFEALEEGTLEEGLEQENRDRLRAVLLYHVAPGRLTQTILERAPSIETLEGHDLKVESVSGRVLVGGAVVSDANIMADNGVIHAVDTVIRPPEEYLEEAERSKTTGMKGGPDAWWW